MLKGFFVLFILLGLSVVQPAQAWNQYKDSFSSSGYVYYFVKCNSGTKWDLIQRSDGWIKASGMGYSYAYKNLQDAAKQLCKE